MCRQIFFSILTVLLFGCSDGQIPASSEQLKTFESDMDYQRKLNISGWCEDGKKVNPDQLENCVQSLTFRSDGTAFITLTDIVNIGSYSVSGNKIYATFESIDVDPSIVFDALDDGVKLIENESKREWLLIQSDDN